ncbi:citrate synthase [Vulcanimicrobium alpinum]|uniref:Citrate synthase n=1 Tax=Vulcanimicrobium alpinum TaxID=3016050 RepID=A0AAN2CBE7_UNVUL|nr:citrate/2-methylcitrate synthase [Vulcanimicrobium alpinum]BDE07918.1 citrate synthase [Vulcanimicrobium alpinum]
MASTVVNPGLEGIVVGETVLSNVEGDVGRLTYRGYDIHDLAEHATYEEVVHLLLFGRLPTYQELLDLKARLVARRSLPSGVVAMLHAVPRDAWPMDVLRTGVSAISHFLPHRPDGSHDTNIDAAIDLVAKFPTLVAVWDRLRRGLEPIAPDSTLDHAANFLWMRSGERPIPAAEAALDTYFILLADHSYNASTFSARVTASTGEDIYGAVAAAVATLAGDLHGGAPSKVMTMLEEIGLPEKAEPYVRALLGRGEKIMGMGHREYKIRDPRAAHLERMAKNLTEKSHTKWYLIARALEDASNAVLAEVKPGKPIYANVEFYTAPTLASLGIPSDEFTCTFACGRIAGWSAHVLEQVAHNRLIRPQATYVGPAVHPYEPIAARNARGNGAASGGAGSYN